MRPNHGILTAAGLAVVLCAGSGAAITADEFIERQDADGDGLLAVEEVVAGALLDADGDGFISREELAAVAALLRGRTFEWVNPLQPGETYPGVRHATFNSPSMGVPVGYCIYLPPGYDDAERAAARYPVVYDLHGGSPGDERTSVRGGLASVVHEAIAGGHVAPAIYVFVNGGAENAYNYPQKDSMGVDVFVHELIPHIDATYRTVAERGGRALQGFSQGGRGATRIMFRYPELFGSAAPGGSGYAMERQVSENGGVERDDRLPGIPERVFAPDENAYDRARAYAARVDRPTLPILIWLGDRDFNYTANLEYMGFLYGLGIPFERLILPGVDHSAKAFEAGGLAVMRFHERNFATAGTPETR